MKFTLALLALVTLLNPLRAADPIEAAQAYLDQHSVYKQDIVKPINYVSLRAQISATRDPQTKFGPYIWALIKPESKVLTPAQQTKLQALIDARNHSNVDWHDVRNIVRVQSLLTLWDYAAETNPKRLPQLEQEWSAWNALRLEYMFQEFVVKERFQRKVWGLLTPKQQQALIAGDYDELIKKNTGHARAFFAHKHVLKAIGKPQDQKAFDQAVAKWEDKWVKVHTLNQAAIKFDRQREQAYHLTDESFAALAGKENGTVFSLFTTSERDAIREIVQTYPATPERAQGIAKIQSTLHAKMLTQYRDHGGDLLRALGEISEK